MSGEITVRWAAADDVAYASQDGYVPEAVVARKIAAGEVAIAERTGERVGYVRLEYLWSTLPYLALIRVAPAHRRQGVGRSLLAFLEQELRARGHAALLSSSQADEAEPQAWHRRQGFTECGILAGVRQWRRRGSILPEAALKPAVPPGPRPNGSLRLTGRPASDRAPGHPGTEGRGRLRLAGRRGPAAALGREAGHRPSHGGQG